MCVCMCVCVYIDIYIWQAKMKFSNRLTGKAARSPWEFKKSMDRLQSRIRVGIDELPECRGIH